MIKTMNRTRMMLAAAVAIALVGCSRTAPPQFLVNLEGKPESAVYPRTEEDRAKRQQLIDGLTALFGTPDDPHLFPEAATALDIKKIKLASGPVGGNADGTQRGLYRQHCVHCHGISGDGAGPTAVFLNPYPRDYRRGIYKFKATERAAKPRDEDLAHVIRMGVPGTAMPAFNLLAKDEIDALVEYVKYLSVRGETETLLSLAIDDFDKGDKLTRELLVEQLSSPTGMWAQAKNAVIATPTYPENNDQRFDIAAWDAAGLQNFYKDAYALAQKKDPNTWHALGEAVFRGGRAQCIKCHGPTALGDGSADDPIFDVWNEDKAKERKARQAAIAAGDKPPEKLYWTLPEQISQPRNLRMGVYRGGRSPADLYRRIHAGVNGASMPEGRTSLKPLEIWSVVDYIRTLPYDAMSKPGGTTPHSTAAVARDRM